jgi:hypothetical protein
MKREIWIREHNDASFCLAGMKVQNRLLERFFPWKIRGKAGRASLWLLLAFPCQAHTRFSDFLLVGKPAEV